MESIAFCNLSSGLIIKGEFLSFHGQFETILTLNKTKEI